MGGSRVGAGSLPGAVAVTAEEVVVSRINVANAGIETGAGGQHWLGR